MERLQVHVIKRGKQETKVEAFCVEDLEGEAEAKAYLRGWLFAERRLYVGTIETAPAWRRQGAASRLLLGTIEILAIRILEAGTSSAEGAALFAYAALRAPGVRFDVDLD